MTMRDFRRLTAGAVETPMSATCPTVLRERLAKMFSGAMQANGQVVPRKVELRSDLGRVFAVKIDLLEKVSVLLRNHGQEAFEALAENAFILHGRRFGKFFLKAFQRPAPSTLPSVNVDDRASENAVEPCGGLLSSFRLPVGGQSLYEAFLYDVLSRMGITQAVPRES